MLISKPSESGGVYAYLQLSQGVQHPYTVVQSKRAKYIRIKLNQAGELSVVVPSRASIKHAHEFVHSKRVWVEKQLKKISPLCHQIPNDLHLKLLDESWSINYKHTEKEQIKLIERDDNLLEIIGDTHDATLVKKVINKWCKQKAFTAFHQMLEDLAETHGFHYKKLSIRSQKTRWGSCSSSKNISLNSKLILFPSSVVRYVIIHELCHTIEMNHSSEFWKLVEDCDPNFKEHRRELKRQGKLIFL